MESTINLIHGDCLPAMKEMKDNAYDLAIIDPPYGINVNMNMGKKKGEKARYEKKDWDKTIPSFAFFKELFRVSTNQIVWGGNYMTEHLPPKMCWLCWDKEVPAGVSFSDFELAWTSFNVASKKINIPYCGFIGLKGESRIHPTQKPVSLYKWILDKYAKKGDKILDTHLGSASIALACWDMGYDLTAYEIDKEYYDAACKRFDMHKRQLKLPWS